MSLFDTDQTKFIKFNNNLINYYYFDGAFDGDMIERLDKGLETLRKDMIEGNTGGVINKSYRNSQILWIPKNEDWKWLYEYMGLLTKRGNDEMWDFNITHMNEQIQYTEYDEAYEGHYDWHVDVGEGQTSMRKISISVQLSDPAEYEGGELQFYFKRDIVTAPKSKGTAILFPSFFLHRVKPVIKGKRRCLVLWISGPPLH